MLEHAASYKHAACLKIITEIIVKNAKITLFLLNIL